MGNASSQKMGQARKAWEEMVKNPTPKNYNDLKAKMNAAGASHRNFSEMEIPMPKEFACEYIHKTPKDLEASLKADFGPDGKFHKSKLPRRVTGTSFKKRA